MDRKILSYLIIILCLFVMYQEFYQQNKSTYEEITFDYDNIKTCGNKKFPK